MIYIYLFILILILIFDLLRCFSMIRLINIKIILFLSKIPKIKQISIITETSICCNRAFILFLLFFLISFYLMIWTMEMFLSLFLTKTLSLMLKTWIFPTLPLRIFQIIEFLHGILTLSPPLTLKLTHTLTAPLTLALTFDRNSIIFYLLIYYL